MFFTRRLFASAILTASVCGGVFAQEPPKSKEQADAKTARKAEAVSDLAKASSLMAFGRGEMAEQTGLKTYKSPEGLVAAGGILLRAENAFGGKMDPLGVEPTNELGEAIKVEEAKLPTLKAEAEALFDEARAMVTTDATKLKSLELLIQQASDVKQSGEERGALGYPRSVQKGILPGGHHFYKIPFVPGVPAAVAMRSTGASKLQFEVIGDGGGRMFNLKGAFAQYQWLPARGKQPRMITINISNIGKVPTVYQLVTN
jgi:hypothetical protein